MKQLFIRSILFSALFALLSSNKKRKKEGKRNARNDTRESIIESRIARGRRKNFKNGGACVKFTAITFGYFALSRFRENVGKKKKGKKENKNLAIVTIFSIIIKERFKRITRSERFPLWLDVCNNSIVVSPFNNISCCVFARDLIARRIIIVGREKSWRLGTKGQVKIPLFTGLPSLFGGGLEINSKLYRASSLPSPLPFRFSLERLKYYKPDGKLSQELSN